MSVIKIKHSKGYTVFFFYFQVILSTYINIEATHLLGISRDAPYFLLEMLLHLTSNLLFTDITSGKAETYLFSFDFTL